MRKTWLLLLPFVAVLFCMYGNAVNFSAAQLHVAPGISRVFSAHSYASSFNVQKDVPAVNKNKIRPKAWDEIGVVALLPVPMPELKRAYYTPRSFSYSRDEHVIQAFIHCTSLRGPPAYII